MYIVAVFSEWYGKMCSMVSCNGVRQGSTLSPALFNLFITAIIMCLKSEGVGCCILYADNTMLLIPSLQGLKDMLNV